MAYGLSAAAIDIIRRATGQDVDESFAGTAAMQNIAGLLMFAHAWVEARRNAT
jgi:hypothetical protein